jgi:dTDP-4-amino-4,6-dideoxy-D-galactose acyltransferase
VTFLEPCQFLRWDTRFFGFPIARVNGGRLNQALLQPIRDWCRHHAIECLYFLADSDHAETVELAEESGFRLVDLRLTLACNPKTRERRDVGRTSVGVRILPAAIEDLPALRSIARTSHTDSRFYFDRHFPVELCASLYETWIEESCRGYADAVFKAEKEGLIVGYLSCHQTGSERQGRIGLAGVAAECRGCGVGGALIEQALGWHLQRQVEQVSVVTQGRNVAAQRLYQRLGFLSRSVQLWYHKWFTERK